jgi:carboxypeptidase PM20D1
VVSAAADSDHWTHPPFSAHLDNNTKYIYGRGTLDTKLTVIGILEAIEHLLQQQQQHEDKPIIDRTLIFALGHDEEVGGEYGAKAMAAILRGRGIQVEAVFDEGGAIFTDGLYPLVLHDTPIAVVGTAEKGFSTWKMVLHGTGGHSSWPVVGTGKNVASQVAKVLAALEKRQQLTRLAPPTSDFLQGLAPHVLWSSVVRLLLENASNRIINPILSQLLGWPAISPPDIQALVRTTCAVVSVSSGSETSHNIIPSTASITINCRLLPGDTSTDVKRYLEDLIKVDLHLPEKPELIQLGESVPGSAVASSHGPHFDLIRRAIQESGLTGGTSARDARGESTINNNNNNNNNTKRVEIVVPLLLTGMTDSRYYADLAEGRVYRFSPLGLNRTGGDMKRIHGIDERVSVENVIEGVRFFMRLITLGTVGIDA